MEQKNKSKGRKGITLVSLVITIIVLLILAGVAINLAMDEEVLIGKAEEAVESWNRAVAEENNAIKNIFMITNEVEGEETEGEVKEVPIPNGYIASEISTEDDVAEGLVIYEIPEGAEVNWLEDEEDGTNKSTITIGGNTTNLQETVNQYVWIPVEEINDMVMCENNNKLADENGNKICNIELVKEGGSEEEILKCTNPAHTKTATNLLGRLYTSTESYDTDEAGNTIYSYTINFEQTDQTYNENNYREPSTISSDEDNSLGLEQLKNDFTVMAKSVAKNGGFYIGRYEVGAGGSSKKGQAVLTAASTGGGSGDTAYLGANMWYGLYNTIRDVEANRQMIWGCQYDQVIKFLKEGEEDPENGHSNRNLTKNHALSGQNELDCMRNIYDLECNHSEWTAEANSANSRVFRGNNYGAVLLYNNFYPASFRQGDDSYGYPTYAYGNDSSRPTLYL